MPRSNPRLRDLDIARIMLASGHSYRIVGKVLAGRHVHPTTLQRVTEAMEKLGLSIAPQKAA